MKPSLHLLVPLAAVLAGCEQTSPNIDAGSVPVSEAIAPIREHPEIGGVRNIPSDDWAAFRTASKPSRFVKASKDTRNAVDILAAACLGVDRVWHCTARRPATFMSTGNSPTIPPAWTVPSWWFDDGNSIGCASNMNSGTSATCVGGCSGAVCPSGNGPVLQWQEIVTHRLGQTNPQLQQPTTFTMLSPQGTNTDYIFFEPYAPNGSPVALIGTLVIKTANFLGGAVTPKNQATGQRLQVAGFPGGTARGDYVLNTDQNSYTVVDVGGASPIFSQPLAAVGVTTIGLARYTEDNGWVSGQHYTVYTRPNANLEQWQPRGGDVSAGGNVSVAWVQWVSVADASGTPNKSTLMVESSAAETIFSGVQINPELDVQGTGVVVGGSDIVGNVLVRSGSLDLYGAISEAGLTSIAGEAVVQGGSLMHGTTAVSIQSSVVHWGDGYVDGANGIVGSPGGNLRLSNFDVSNAVWGTGSIELDQMASVLLRTGTWPTTILSSGGLFFISQAAGFTPQVCGNFMANGSTQVNVAPGGGLHFPANATISISMASVGGAPGAIFFSANQTADSFHVKSTSATDSSTYQWCAGPASVQTNVTNLNTYLSLTSETSLSVFSNTP